MSPTPVAHARALIVSGVEPAGAESVSIFDAAGRILAEDLKARLTQPPFPASAMDGYAVRADDLTVLPARLKIVGVSAAGHGFGGEVGPGGAARIFTGAPVPSGADTVVIQENTKAIDKGEVEILEGARLGQNIRPRGNDFAEGEVLLAAGTRLGARQLMLAAAMKSREPRRAPQTPCGRAGHWRRVGRAGKRDWAGPDRFVDPGGRESRHRGVGRRGDHDAYRPR